MEIYKKSFDTLKEELSIKEAQEVELIDHIISSSDNLSPISLTEQILSNSDLVSLAFSNLTGDNIKALVASNNLLDSILEDTEVQPEQLTKNLDTAKLAYHLAFLDPEFGTQLFEELEYYRKLGRI